MHTNAGLTHAVTLCVCDIRRVGPGLSCARDGVWAGRCSRRRAGARRPGRRPQQDP